MTDKIEERACKLCAESNGSACTTPKPDPNHWICKAWLEKARLVSPAIGEDGLLSEEEILNAYYDNIGENAVQHSKGCKAIAKTQYLKDQAHEQARVDRIKKEIEQHDMSSYEPQLLIPRKWWREFWDKELKR